MLFSVLKARKISISPEQRKMVESCRDLDLVDTWIVRAATANSAADILHDVGDK